MLKNIKVAATILLITAASTTFAFAQTKNEAVQAFTLEIRYIFSGLMALALVIAILITIMHFISLASHSNSPIHRRMALDNLLKSGISVALMGAINVIVAILYFTAWR